MSEDSIQVQVGLTVKVTNPNNQYENSTFSRSITRKQSIAAPPEDLDKMEAYKQYVSNAEDTLESELREKVETLIQAEVDQFYKDNEV